MQKLEADTWYSHLSSSLGEGAGEAEGTGLGLTKGELHEDRVGRGEGREQQERMKNQARGM